MPWKSFPALDPKNPNRDNGPEHDQAANPPTRRVNRAIRFRSVDHIIVPVSHNSLLELASGSWVSARGPRFKHNNRRVGRRFHWCCAPKSSFGGKRRARGANQFVGFDENVGVVGLLSGKKADGHKRRAKQQAGQHDLPVRMLVGIVK
jgi:hypothetical protein